MKEEITPTMKALSVSKSVNPPVELRVMTKFIFRNAISLSFRFIGVQQHTKGTLLLLFTVCMITFSGTYSHGFPDMSTDRSDIHGLFKSRNVFQSIVAHVQMFQTRQWSKSLWKNKEISTVSKSWFSPNAFAD